MEEKKNEIKKSILQQVKDVVCVKEGGEASNV